MVDCEKLRRNDIYGKGWVRSTYQSVMEETYARRNQKTVFSCHPPDAEAWIHPDGGDKWSLDPRPYSSDTAEGWAAMREMVEWAQGKGWCVCMDWTEDGERPWLASFFTEERGAGYCTDTKGYGIGESLPHALSLCVVAATEAGAEKG